MELAEFAEVIWFTDNGFNEAPKGVKPIEVSIGGLADVNRLYAKIAAAYVATSHYLVVQWDSWIVDPTAWTDDFLRFDYIGAPWWHKDGYNVGNGGFSLRSTKMAGIIRDFPAINFDYPEDEEICRRWRPDLERRGVMFAPESLAYSFSKERTGWQRSGNSFGFHGIFNWPKFLTREEIEARFAQSSYARSRPEYREVLHQLSDGHAVQFRQ